MNYNTIFNIKNLLVLRKDFQRNGYAYLPNAITHEGVECFQRIYNELKKYQNRKDFLMPQSHNTPRKMDVIGGYATNTDIELTCIYKNLRLKTVLSVITGIEVSECENLVENIIFTVMHDTGDTHGWHIDDYPIAFIIGVDVSDDIQGGLVEIKNPDGSLANLSLKQGDAYILRSDILEHRVTPISNVTRRIIANFTYNAANNRVIPNGSANLLCS